MPAKTHTSKTVVVVSSAAAIALLTAGLADAAAPTLAHVAQGLVRGQILNGVAVYRAIPYAEPPVGDLRFNAPQPRKPWPGVFDAAQDGPSCPQGATADPAGKASTDEDCLRLNIFAPAAKAKAPRAVMVWIHGGGFAEGFAGARQYDPSAMVKEGGVVVVSINYRLNTFGFLATKSLDDANGKPSGNWGIRDQQAALRWVHRNIAAFGGDPNNVTIVGESAGAASVVALVASPASKGLFEKAIAQSIPDNTHTHRREAVEASGEALAEKVGCPAGPDQAGCLRKLPVESILKARGRGDLVEDPEVLPVDPYTAFRDGQIVRAPILFGSNLHEGWFFVGGNERALGHPMSADDYVTATKIMFPDKADNVMQKYPADSQPTPAQALGEAAGDLRFACYTDLARVGAQTYVPVYGYELNQPNPVQQQPRKKFSLDNTDYHTTDLAYLFDYVTDGPLQGEDAVLGKRMRAYWIQFAKTGSPNRKGLPLWPRYRGEQGQVLNLSVQGGVSSDFNARHRCSEMRDAGLVSWDMQ
jgi:para-nitrobenzyl esterase